jgi:hypothetical protein
MTKDQLFVRLANFLHRNVGLVADHRDSNAPWTLLEQLQDYEFYQRRRRRKKKDKR